MEDKQIIRLLFARAEQALEVLGKQFGPRLLHTARNILSSHQDAEECVNDTYLAVWNAIPPKEPDPLSGYVYTTCLWKSCPAASPAAVWTRPSPPRTWAAPSTASWTRCPGTAGSCSYGGTGSATA